MVEKIRQVFLCTILLGLYVVSFAQTRAIDSIKVMLRTARVDTDYVKEVVNLGWMLRNVGQYDSSLAYEKKGRELAERLGFKKQLGKALTISGIVYMDKGEYDSAQVYYMASLKVRQEIGDKKGIAAVYNNLGNLYESQGNLPRALQMQLMGLKIREEIKDKKEIAISYNNLGNIYEGLGSYGEALRNFLASIKLKQEIGDSLGMAMSYGNIGLIHEARREHEKALENYFISLHIEKQLGFKSGVADCYNNIGQVYHHMGMEQRHPEERTKYLALGLEHYQRGLQLSEELGDKQGVATAYSNLGSIDYALNDMKRAELYCIRALALAQELHDLYLLQQIHQTLSNVYTATGRHQLALDHFKSSIVMRDSVNNEANTKRTVQLEMQYEFDKKEAAARLEQEKKDAVAAAEARRQRIILFSISGFGLLVLGFAVFAYRSFLQKKRANEEITRQKHVIEEKQKEILDSIYYARRIQRCLLTSEKYIDRNLRERRVLHTST